VETNDEVPGLNGFDPAVEVVGPEIVVEGGMLEHMVGSGGDRGEGPDRLFRAVSGAQALELRLEIAAVFAGRRPGALDQGGLEPGAPPPSQSGLYTSFDDKHGQVVYEMAACLDSRWVAKGLYDRAVEALGHVGITDIICLMGYYTMVSMTLAFYDVPAGARAWLAELRPVPGVSLRAGRKLDSAPKNTCLIGHNIL
jgi:hypothetical protein